MLYIPLQEAVLCLEEEEIFPYFFVQFIILLCLLYIEMSTPYHTVEVDAACDSRFCTGRFFVFLYL